MPPDSKHPSPLKIFHCYSHRDGELRDELETAIAGLKRDKFVISWHDRKISPGMNWREEISSELDTADIVLLYVSPDFIESGYCVSVEMERAFQNRNAERPRIIPVILRPYVWTGAPWRELQPLPQDGIPVTKWENPSDAFQNIAEGLQRVVEEIRAGPAPEPPRDQTRPAKDLLDRVKSHLARASTAFAMVGLLVFALLLQHLAYLFEIGQSDSALQWLYAPVDPAYFYQRKSLAVVHRANTFPIGIITLSRKTEPQEIFDNLCVQRAFVASLLTRIAPIHPRVIVLDKYYLAASCPAPMNTGTSGLHKAIDLLGQQGTRVVIGQDSIQPFMFSRLITPDLQVVTPGQIDFARQHPDAAMGLIRLNADQQKLPLSWPTFASGKEAVSGTPLETATLALVAARAYRSTVDSDVTLSRMLREQEHPLVSLSPLSEFSLISARALFCGNDPNSEWRNCASTDVARLPDTIRHPVLFIGNDDSSGDEDPESRDYFKTSAGKMPGVVLQANYTLSILEGRFYAPVPAWVEFMVAGSFVLFLEMGARKLRATPESVVKYSIMLTLLADLVVIILLVQRREYLPVWIPLMPIFLTRFGIEKWKVAGGLRRFYSLRAKATGRG